MYLSNDELTIVFNGDHYKSKQTYGLAQSNYGRVNAQDITKARVSSSLFCLLLAKCGFSAKQLINKADTYYQNELRDHDYSDENWFYILKHHPEIFVNPLVYYKDHGIICSTPTDVLRLSS